MHQHPQGTATGPVRHGESSHPSDSGLRSLPSLLAAFTGPETSAIWTVRQREAARVSPFVAQPRERPGQHRVPDAPVTVVLVDEPATAPIRLDAANTQAWPWDLADALAPRVRPAVAR